MAEQVFKKEASWNGSSHDFVGEDEITVTITLAEYRELVKKDAGHENELSKLRKMWLDEQTRVRALQKKLDSFLALTEDEGKEVNDD